MTDAQFRRTFRRLLGASKADALDVALVWLSRVGEDVPREHLAILDADELVNLVAVVVRMYRSRKDDDGATPPLRGET